MQIGPLKSICEPLAPCKVCGEPSPLLGVVDFNKHCLVASRPDLLPLSGVPVYYHRCPSCHFIFTTAFDSFTPDDFRRHVYNEQYALIDPEYAEERPAI